MPTMSETPAVEPYGSVKLKVNLIAGRGGTISVYDALDTLVGTASAFNTTVTAWIYPNSLLIGTYTVRVQYTGMDVSEKSEGIEIFGLYTKYTIAESDTIWGETLNENKQIRYGTDSQNLGAWVDYPSHAQEITMFTNANDEFWFQFRDKTNETDTLSLPKKYIA